jgi:hypothetical protein
MTAGADTVKNSVIHEIKKKIRLIILIASFVIVTLFGIILADLYKKAFPFLDFFSDCSNNNFHAHALLSRPISFDNHFQPDDPDHKFPFTFVIPACP